jgi:hypothetical protein
LFIICFGGANSHINSADSSSKKVDRIVAGDYLTPIIFLKT